MKIAVKLYRTKKADSKVLAVGSITLDDKLVLDNIFVKTGTKGPFPSMPSRKTGRKQKDNPEKDEYRDYFFPITKEFREELYGAIMDAYKKLPEGDAAAAKEPAQRDDDDQVPF